MLALMGCPEMDGSDDDDTAGNDDDDVAPDDDDDTEEPDPTHCDDPPIEGSVTIDETCTYVPTVSSFEPVVEWSMPTFEDYPDYMQAGSTPMVGQLTDDNGDGQVDQADTPDIVFVSWFWGQGFDAVLRVVSGDGSAVHSSTWEAPYDGYDYSPYRYSGVALGDLDNDGVPEIVTTVTRANSCFAAAYNADGSLEWVLTSPTVLCRSNHPAIHDLDADGWPEVVFGDLILDGADGSLRGAGGASAGYNEGYVNSGYHSFGQDLDGDGIMEVSAGGEIYTPDGLVVCTTGYADGYPAAADLDGDGRGEIVVSGNNYIRTFEDDCALIHEWPVNGGGWGGPPTIADFDGDGQPEIAVAGQYDYTVYETDGTVVWDAPITDESSNSTGSSVFDFDGDGAAEVVYADEYDLWVYDGASGEVIYQGQEHGSGTANEYPVIADVDGDGKAEIVVPNVSTYEPATGIYVVGDLNDEWVSARTVWNQQAWYITNIDDDLTVPAPAAANWPTYNNFRQGAPGCHLPQGAANLFPVAYEACQEACGDPVEILVQVANEGLIQVGGDTTLAIVGETAEGQRELLGSVPLGASLQAGTLTSAYSFVFEAPELLAYVRVWGVVDHDEASKECDESDNEAEVDVSLVCE